jgi:hypothetical protein
MSFGSLFSGCKIECLMEFVTTIKLTFLTFVQNTVGPIYGVLNMFEITILVQKVVSLNSSSNRI